MRCLKLVSLGLLAIAVFRSEIHAADSPGEIIRGIYCHPGPAVDNRVWGAYGKGYEVDTDERHSGGSSIRCVNVDDVEAHGARQEVVFNQDKPRPLVVAGWAKLDGVTGPPSYRCSVYLDLRLKDGKSWPMKIAAFDPGKKGWQYSEKTYTPPAPIVSAAVYVFLRQSKGQAWFDDIYVGEIINDEGTRSKNLLQAPGFESERRVVNKLRDEFFKGIQSLGCNAFHFYRSVSWDRLMAGGADAPPPIAADDPLLDFVRDAHDRNLKVWLTVGAPSPPIKDALSSEFPFYACVNGRWGEVYTRAVAYFTQYGFDGIGVVPDEWTYTNGRVKRRFAKHGDPKVARFYKGMPSYCDCGVCRRAFEKRYDVAYPDVSKPWSSADPAWSLLVEFRYDSTSAWIQRTVAAAKRVRPEVVTDTMIGVHPICLDDRIGAGAAWDKIGVDAKLDCLQTDPYIFLHNYLGDSTHYYATETAIHLTSANWQRRSGVTLEACRLRDKYRPKDPAEVYGAALSCLIHGAREFFWWHMTYLRGQRPYVEPGPPRRRVTAVYRVIKEMEPFVLGASPPGDVLVLYSRASEDTWDRLGRRRLLPEQFGKGLNAKRGFVAHKNVLYFLLRRGYPFRMTYLDNPDPAKLSSCRVALMPFPLSLTESQVNLIERMAREGKTIVLMSELSPLDELGNVLREPRLARLFGGAKPSGGRASAQLGKGKVMFFGDDFAVRLFETIKPVKDPKVRVPLPPFDVERAEALDKTLTQALGSPGSVFAAQPELDIEATVLDGERGRLVLAINWDTEKPSDVEFRQGVTRGRREATGFSIDAKASVKELRLQIGEVFKLHIEPQEALLLRLR